MANRWVIGNTVVPYTTYQKLSGAPSDNPTYLAYDPVTPTLKISDPTGVKTTLTYPGTNMFRDGLGQYHATLGPALLSIVGTWTYQWDDPDPTVPGLAENTFSMVAAKIT
ncbi:MAG: hypothetical protein LC793_24080 [Thermomicrobia bacterium]|nr:hypothetical protein [Thermomicrobia bacterium]